MQALYSTLESVIRDLYAVDQQPELTRPDEQFGDYATNVAMQLAGRLRRNPREVADEVVAALKEKLGDQVSDISIAGPGFINIKLSDSALADMAAAAPGAKPDTYKGQIVVTEYSDPNPFKILHAGHLYTSVVGYAIGSLLHAAGAEIHRVNFGGDVGLHVGKTMWAMLKDLGGEHPENLAEIPVNERSAWMAQCYVTGNNAYDEDEAAKQAIVELNKKVYQLHETGERETPFAQMYWTCREWSYEAFDEFYARIGTPFEKYYPESICAPIGIQTVKDHIKPGIYEESDGAIVFKGEPYGLHTRVFINSQGIPTYEAKDVGLIMLKKQDYDFDRSVIITDNGQEQYMAVVLKSIEQFAPELAAATTHLTHGIVKMKGGVKMSSRKGNILRAGDVLDAAAEANRQATGRDDEQAVLGAVKYAFLKQRIGPDIIYTPEESISLEGNSGPYLQYAHARARSILSKSSSAPVSAIASLQPGERSLARKISEYPEIVQQAVDELMPHHICTYLYELAQVFNRFYEHNRVVGDAREAIRVKLVALYADVLKDGLEMLGIAAPERM
ncbi:MAG TPA: arginine--tRNA ligase [Candidatus Saccharimonadales bacterium]|nr:arginine--tRNA ligase [Candidatus Saccharimonadales bacterium]